MTLSWEVERVLSLKILNIDSSIDPFVHLSQICQGGGQKIQSFIHFPPEYSQVCSMCSLKKNFLFVLFFSFVILTIFLFAFLWEIFLRKLFSYASPPPMRFGFGLNQSDILVLQVLLSKPRATIILLTLDSQVGSIIRSN